MECQSLIQRGNRTMITWFRRKVSVKKLTNGELSELARELSEELYFKGYDEVTSLRLSEVRDEMNTRGGRVVNHRG